MGQWPAVSDHFWSFLTTGGQSIFTSENGSKCPPDHRFLQMPPRTGGDTTMLHRSRRAYAGGQGASGGSDVTTAPPAPEAAPGAARGAPGAPGSTRPERTEEDRT
jgi:hypothetical protein